MTMRTLNIPESLYQRLEAATHRQGLDDIVQLLDNWERQKQATVAGTTERHQAVTRIARLHDRLRTQYGEFPDSVDLLREDRER